MAALGNRSQADGHFLDEISDRTQQDQEPDQAITILGTRGSVGSDTAGIIIGDHDQNAGSSYQCQESQEFPHPAIAVVHS